MRRITIAVIVLLLVVLGGIALVRPWKKIGSPPAPVVTEQPNVTPAERHAQWIASVSSTLAQYDIDKRADKARDALLALRVNVADKEIHLALVLAFQGIIDQTKGANAQLEQAKKDFFAAIK